MVYCCAVGCVNDSSKQSKIENEKISFYRLPNDKKIQKLWIDKIRRPKVNLPPYRNIRICHLHFEEECFERDLKSELLNLPIKRILKKDAVPTLFSYLNKGTKRNTMVSHKARNSYPSNEIEPDVPTTSFENQEYFYDDTNSNIDKQSHDQSSVFSCTVGIQHQVQLTDKSTQTEPTCEYNISYSTESDIEDIENISDSSYQEDDTVSEDTEDTEEDVLDYDNVKNFPNNIFLIVYWQSLLKLLCRCIMCGKDAIIENIKRRGSVVKVFLYCVDEHHTTWISQPRDNPKGENNIRLAAGVLFSANTFARIRSFFETCRILFIHERQFYRYQKDYLFGVSNEFYLKHQSENIKKIIHDEKLLVGGDGRCDSPGHTAKYCTYSLSDQKTNRILCASVTQVTETGNSNAMEKLGFVKALKEIEEKGIKIKQITTDRHLQIRKYLREERPDLNHQFDVWHVCKNLNSKIMNAAKKKSCNILGRWGKSIKNHFWWSCATCKGDVNLLREKWTSILFHVQGVHEWQSNTLFHRCAHGLLPIEEGRTTERINPETEAFSCLQKIVLNPRLLNDLNNLTAFSHTGSIEVKHAIDNKWTPKNTHFSYTGMLARSQLAIIDFNLGADLEQAETSTGEKRFYQAFSKMTKGWTVKPVKIAKDRKIFQEMVDRAVYVFLNNEVLPVPTIPDLPANISTIEKPDKKEAVLNLKSRFK